MILVRSLDNGTTWQSQPLPVPPGDQGTTIDILPDGSIFGWSYGASQAVYLLRDGASAWQQVAPFLMARHSPFSTTPPGTPSRYGHRTTPPMKMEEPSG
jgi:photosystem II stability/assembly factor-like uncharacterized protein